MFKYTPREMRIVDAALCFLAANFEEYDWDHWSPELTLDEVAAVVRKHQAIIETAAEEQRQADEQAAKTLPDYVHPDYPF